MTIRFDGQVAIVTGAGRGMGRDIAEQLARRGAKVMVNDYGGAASTLAPGTIDVAQGVADRIQSLGGIAIADATMVGTGESARAIVDRVIAAFGRVDILVNNAGGSVVGELDAFDDDEIEGVVRTNFLGPYMLMRRVWPHMRAQGYGRIVNIMSSAMMGMGQIAPYASAKAGLMGLNADAAIQGREYAIGVNGVCPVAYSRLAKGGPPEVAARLKQFYPPALAAEGVVFLCSRECDFSGEVLYLGGGRAARYAMFRNTGLYDAELDADRLAARSDEMRDMRGAAIVRTDGFELGDPSKG